MAKARSAAEAALIARAEAFKEARKISRWGQAAHALFIASEAKRAGASAEQAKLLWEQLSLIGLGGNASQFAQACGWREASAASASAELDDIFKSDSQA